jgi:serine/threonine protein phosphatase PrpC
VWPPELPNWGAYYAMHCCGACKVSFFAVFDGHGGRQCAEYAAERLRVKVMAAGLVPPTVSIHCPQAAECTAQ